MKLRYSEAFYSLQGEGKFVGVPSVFLRTFGCNLRCQNFGLNKDRPKERYNPEVKKLIDDGVHIQAKTLEDLPIIHTGCDTYASIYPDFKHLMMDKTVDEVVDHLLSLTPTGDWILENGQDIHLVITGGEPLLGWQKFYSELLSHPKMESLRNITFETNGTQMLKEDLYFDLCYHTFKNITFSISPKLSVSGEAWKDAIKPEVVSQYQAVTSLNRYNSDLYLKFVVATEEDIDEVDKAVAAYRDLGDYAVHCPVYLMPMGGHSEEYNLTAPQVAQLALERGYRFTPRLHLDLYGNEWGT